LAKQQLLTAVDFMMMEFRWLFIDVVVVVVVVMVIIV